MTTRTKLRPCTAGDHQRLEEIWDDSVRHSHDFLTETDILEIRSKLSSCYFPNVALTAIEESAGQLRGFIGLSDDKIEMLFVETSAQGRGLGSALLNYALDLGYRHVDVNEDNPAALAFYRHHGFEVESRDPIDSDGRPFPLLHLRLKAMRLQRANLSQVDQILAIMDSARAYQRELGFRQWEDGYPSRDIIERDIRSGNAYVLPDSDGAPIAYSVLMTGDENYDLFADRWHYNDGPYGVVHRIAIAPEARGRGISSILFGEYERLYLSKGIDVIKIDTGLDNRPMHHLLAKHGYSCRGHMPFTWGDRLGYEKRLTPINQ